MTNVDVSKLSLKGVEQLTQHCEHLIHSHKADLSDYELYIECQTELVRRSANAKKLPFAGSPIAQFVSG